MEWWVWALLVVAVLIAIAWRWPRQFEAVGNALSEGGQRTQQLGCGLTLAVTFPIVGLFAFGPVGLLIGAVIGLLFGGGMIAQACSRKP